MATQYTQQATQQLAPVFDQQQTAIQAQIPAIQQLYETLTQGLQGTYQTQLAGGVKNIVEDASARGVLRSTLPVDARQALTGQLGAALQQSLGELGAKQAGQVAGVQTQLGELGIRKAGAITDLSRALETQDLEKQRLELQRQEAERNHQLELQKLAIARQTAASKGGGTPSRGAQTDMTKQSLQQDIANAFRAGGAGAQFYTERTVLPALYQAYGSLGNDAINRAVYDYRKNALGY